MLSTFSSSSLISSLGPVIPDANMTADILASPGLSVTAMTAASAGTTTPGRIAASGIFGSISIACWVVLLVPQLLEQFRTKSSEGISIPFLAAWFLGDLANLVGAVWGGLLREMILLAVWFCFADLIELASAVYYRYYYKSSLRGLGPIEMINDVTGETNRVESQRAQEAEEQALLFGAEHGRPNHPQHQARNYNAISAEDEFIEAEAAKRPSGNRLFLKYGLPVVLICAAGFIGYLFSNPEASDDVQDGHKLAAGPQVMGYISALLYLTARIPQIVKNHRERSTKGLALLFFIYSTIGNFTYALQILCFSSDPDYVLLNLSWLLGSLGTVFQDAIIFLQFYLYRDNDDLFSDSFSIDESATPIEDNLTSFERIE
ncbi:PQ loop repeat-domain-containing protein [Dipodascopsis tothii]|uniref:PQ loop repeat-domain-containing protein n=1 Tax=Dipodascopsis tothii TaxID=44089 RepID=UPI0034CECF36